MTGRMQRRRARLSFSIAGVRQQKQEPRRRPRLLPFPAHLGHPAPSERLGPAAPRCARAPCPPWPRSKQPGPLAAPCGGTSGAGRAPSPSSRGPESGALCEQRPGGCGGRPPASPSPFNPAMKNPLPDALQEGRCLPSLQAALQHPGVSRRVFLELGFGSCSFELDCKRWGSSRRHRARRAQAPSPPAPGPRAFAA